ncbi:hypothetical protein H2248_012214 [Termitomyces sp. 'cryptogamus']|nr:hypothetical protein H2248_012214 [Termitomyces sp. 'cryptogamus']
MKDGSTTNFTIEHYAGLKSIELAIYNYDNLKLSSDLLGFSAKENSGSLIFDGQGHMVSIIHSAMLCDGSLHVKYAMPAWWAIEELKKRYSYADFDYTSF